MVTFEMLNMAAMTSNAMSDRIILLYTLGCTFQAGKRLIPNRILNPNSLMTIDGDKRPI